MPESRFYKTNKVIYPGDGTALIELSGGYGAIVDEVDAPWLTEMGCWCKLIGKNKNKIYVVSRCRKTKNINIIHRIITNAPNGFEVDHINGNTLDNRRSNLRVCTSSENQHNRRINMNNRSGVKGVGLHNNGKWRARIKLNNKSIFLGYFDTKEEAASAVAAARIKLHGEFANHGQHPNQHLGTSYSVPTTYSPTMQENMCDHGQ